MGSSIRAQSSLPALKTGFFSPSIFLRCARKTLSSRRLRVAFPPRDQLLMSWNIHHDQVGAPKSIIMPVVRRQNTTTKSRFRNAQPFDQQCRERQTCHHRLLTANKIGRKRRRKTVRSGRIVRSGRHMYLNLARHHISGGLSWISEFLPIILAGAVWPNQTRCKFC